jgi:hypothetical protein
MEHAENPPPVDFKALEVEQARLLGPFAQANRNVAQCRDFSTSDSYRLGSAENQGIADEMLASWQAKVLLYNGQIKANQTLLDLHEASRRKTLERAKLVQEDVKNADALNRTIGAVIAANPSLVFSLGGDPISYWNALESYFLTSHSNNLEKAAIAALRLRLVGNTASPVWIKELVDGTLMPDGFTLIELKNQFLTQFIGPLWNSGDQDAVYSVYYGHSGPIVFCDLLETKARYTNVNLNYVSEASAQLRRSILYKIPDVIRSHGSLYPNQTIDNILLSYCSCFTHIFSILKYTTTYHGSYSSTKQPSCSPFHLTSDGRRRKPTYCRL